MEISSSEESVMAPQVDRRDLIDFLCGEELTDADSQDRESTSNSESCCKNKEDFFKQQRELGLAVMIKSRNESFEVTPGTELENIIADIILPRSVARAIDTCYQEQRKILDFEDVMQAARCLGFEKFLEPLKKYMQEHAHFKTEESVSSGNGAAYDEFFNLKAEEDDACTDVPGYDDWYKNVQDLMAMVHNNCCRSCPCRIVKFTRENYK